MKTKMKEKWLDIMDAVNIIPDGRTVLVKMENGAFKTAKYDVKNGIVGFFRKNKLIYPKMWHEINLDDYILELCPECEEEIIIFTHGITACNHCGYPVYPCSGCRRPNCEECAYDGITSKKGRKANNRKILKKRSSYCICCFIGG